MRRALIAAVLLFGCEVDFSKPKQPDPGLAQRIAQKKNDLMKSPDDVKTLVELGELQLEAGQLFDASETFTAARRTGSDDIRINAGLSATYLDLGYVKAGIEELKSCIERDRNQPDCLFQYGRLVEGDQSPQALQELRQVWLRFLELAPNHRKASYVRSSLEQIEAQLENVKAQQPDQPANPLAEEPKPAEQPGAPPASPPVAEAAPIPGHPGGTPEEADDVGELNEFGQAISRAIAAVSKNDAAGAEAAFRDALKIRPKDPSAMAGLAETLFAQNEQEEAIKTIEKAWELDPKDAQVRWAFGVIMMKNKMRMGEALAAWEALNADDPEYAKRLGIPERLETIKKYMAPGGGHPPTK
jgi:cytochrome c-type biogenesis protein CcmH/NrfG